MKLLITGTGKGLGEALALYYLENGNEVYGISRSKSSKLGLCIGTPKCKVFLKIDIFKMYLSGFMNT